MTMSNWSSKSVCWLIASAYLVLVIHSTLIALLWFGSKISYQDQHSSSILSISTRSKRDLESFHKQLDQQVLRQDELLKSRLQSVSSFSPTPPSSLPTFHTRRARGDQHSVEFFSSSQNTPSQSGNQLWLSAHSKVPVSSVHFLLSFVL